MRAVQRQYNPDSLALLGRACAAWKVNNKKCQWTNEGIKGGPLPIRLGRKHDPHFVWLAHSMCLFSLGSWGSQVSVPSLPLFTPWKGGKNHKSLNPGGGDAIRIFRIFRICFAFFLGPVF